MPTIFPPDPEIDDVYENYRWDGTAWVLIGLDLTKDYAEYIDFDAHRDATTNVHGIEDTAYLSPVGVVVPFAGSTAPSGWLICDGSPVSRTTYSELFTVIGTTYGAGDGSTTFNLPSLLGRTVFGYDPLNSNYDTIGKSSTASATATSSLVEANIPSHTHTLSHTHGLSTQANHTHSFVNDGSHGHSFVSAGSHAHNTTGVNANDNLTGGGGSHSHGGNTSNSGNHVHGTVIASARNQYPLSGNFAAYYVNNATQTDGGGDHGHNIGTDTHNGHNHSISIQNSGSHDHSFATANAHSHSFASDGTHSHTTDSQSINTTSSTGSGTSFSVQNPYITMNYIIRAS